MYTSVISSNKQGLNVLLFTGTETDVIEDMYEANTMPS